MVLIEVALDVTRDERAVRHYRQPPGARIVERRPGEPAAQSQALIRHEDLGVDEGDASAAKAVLGVACQLAVSPDLVTVLRWVVADLGVYVSSIRARLVAYQMMPSALSRL